MTKLVNIILLVSCIQLKDQDDMQENKRSDNNTRIGVPLLFNGHVFDFLLLHGYVPTFQELTYIRFSHIHV